MTGTCVHQTLRRRLRQAVEADGRQLGEIAQNSGYSVSYFSNTINSRRRAGNPTIGAVWAMAGALKVNPLWLLGSDDYAPPLPQGVRMARFKPAHLPQDLWARVDADRAAGRAWPDICAALEAELGVPVEPQSLSRGWKYHRRTKLRARPHAGHAATGDLDGVLQEQ